MSPDGDLTLTTVLVEDDGVYKCVANNSRGSVQAFAVLTVHGELCPQSAVLLFFLVSNLFSDYANVSEIPPL